ncbi:MAG: serine/threonine protein kinase, partial [Myxococcales bacterium]|nr:serine/threonine protein kinase [Myxococcales bacterium]
MAAQRRDSAAMRRLLPRDPDISRTPTEIRPSPHDGVPPVKPAGPSPATGAAAVVAPPPAPPGGPAPVAGAIGVGTVLDDKYRLVRLLGKGGVGEVYEAVHELIGLRVAVKLIRFEYASNAELNQRFLQEARAAAAVGHPGIVQIHDVGRTPDGRTYLVMEYLDGEDLEKQLGRERRLGLDQTAGILCDVLDALAAAHAKGIIHRDMKPENVFLVPGRHGERVTKLLDFGIARLNDEVQTATRLTRPGSVMGTPYYMCPEQARGDQHVDAGVDIYAVGVMLYEMLTGELPFSGNTYNEVLSKVLSQPFPSLRAKRDDVPEEVERIVFRATARERSARYATALEFAEALAPFRSVRMPALAPAPERRSPTAETPLPTTSQPSLPPPRPDDAGPDDAIYEVASPTDAGAAAPPQSEPPAARAPGAGPATPSAAAAAGPRRRW